MKPTLVKLDENLGEAHAALLRQAGYGVERVYDEGLSGKSDEIVWERTCAEGRLFITLDMDFADIRRYGTTPHPGVLLIRARTKGQQSVLAALARITPRERARLSAGVPGGCRRAAHTYSASRDGRGR